MTREELLKDYILKQYKSVREFCMANNYPYSTVDSIFKRGMMNSSVSIMISICDRLGIDLESLIDGQIVEKAPTLETLTLKERALIFAYRNAPAMQSAVDKLLGLSSDSATVKSDMISTVSSALEKSYAKK